MLMAYSFATPLSSPSDLPPKPVLVHPWPTRRAIHGASYSAAAVRAEVVAVRCAPEGTRNDQLNRSAFSLGTLVGSGEIEASDVISELVAAATAAGLDEHEIERTITSGLKNGIRAPRQRRVRL